MSVLTPEQVAKIEAAAKASLPLSDAAIGRVAAILAAYRKQVRRNS